MRKKAIGFALLALASSGLGLATGQVFFRLFQNTVPPIALGSFQFGAAHVAFLMYGVGLGGVIFGFGFLICILAPMFRDAKPTSAAAATDSARR